MTACLVREPRHVKAKACVIGQFTNSELVSQSSLLHNRSKKGTKELRIDTSGLVGRDGRGDQTSN